MNDLSKISIDNIVEIFVKGDINMDNFEQIEKCIKSLNGQEAEELNIKLKNNLSVINKRLELDRLKIANRSKRSYERIAKRIFNNINPYALSEIYETSRCLNLELTSGVYFLRNLDNGLLKIGYGENLTQRIKQIARAFKHVGYNDNLKLEAIHLCFAPHLGLTEKYFHNEFKNKRVKGEWFDVDKDELVDYFLLGDLEGEFIKDVLVSWGDYESLYFEPLEKDFEINLREMEYEIFKDVLYFVDDRYLFRHGVRNKFYQIIRTVDENKVGINAIELAYVPEIKKLGITTKDATNIFDFLGLKSYKYDSEEVNKIISKINNTLLHE